MYIRFMHTTVARTLCAVIGFLLVLQAVYQPLPVAALLVVIGTVIAVTGIADVCIVEQVTAARRRTAASEPRARHA